MTKSEVLKKINEIITKDPNIKSIKVIFRDKQNKHG